MLPPFGEKDWSSNPGLRSLGIGFGVLVTPSDAEKLDELAQGIQKNWPRRPLDLLGGYTDGSHVMMTHIRSLYVEETEEQERVQVDLDFVTYHEEEGVVSSVRRRLSRDAQKIIDFLTLLTRFSNEIHFHCRLNWHFSVDNINTIIRLPLLEIPIPGTPYEQIRGVRFGGATDSDEYAILDLDSEDQIHLTISLQYFGALSDPIIDMAIQKGEELRKILLRLKD